MYLTLDSIENGETFTGEDQEYGYFRLLFSSSEETQSVFVEKINIVGDGLVQLEQRIKLTPQLVSGKYETTNFEYVGWETAVTIKIRVDDSLVDVNLNTVMKQNQ